MSATAQETWPIGEVDQDSNPGSDGLSETVSYLRGLHAALLITFGRKKLGGLTRNEPDREAPLAW